MKVKVEEKNYSIIELYNAVATEMGYMDVSELQYDCRHINVAPNIQEGFYRYYTELAKETNKTMTETFIKTSVTTALAIYGPKVDNELKANEIEVFDGFIS